MGAKLLENSIELTVKKFERYKQQKNYINIFACSIALMQLYYPNQQGEKLMRLETLSYVELPGLNSNLMTVCIKNMIHSRLMAWIDLDKARVNHSRYIKFNKKNNKVIADKYKAISDDYLRMAKANKNRYWLSLKTYKEYGETFYGY